LEFVDRFFVKAPNIRSHGNPSRVGRSSTCGRTDGMTRLTFKNRASYIQDGRTATLQMLQFIYIFFQQL